jgi:hypothetical protein
MTRHVAVRLPWSLACVLLAAGSSLARAQAAPDTAAAIAGLEAFDAACARDHGAWWGRTLCGPVILVDLRTRFAVANHRPPGGDFAARGALWIGRMPKGIGVANTSIEWAGARWATVLLPLPTDSLDRLALLLHESFHRIQPAIGLAGPDAQNPHLDERDGRYWLRLELRALARALTATDDSVRAIARDAATFRAMRYRLYPGADTLEAQLERAEGLAEYTGLALALATTGDSVSEVAERTRQGEHRATYVRSLGYLTGPALGLLLDRLAPGWRDRVKTAGFAAQLGPAVGWAPPADLAEAARAGALRYGGPEIAREEDQRATEQARRRAAVEARLVRGPVVEFRQAGLARSFNPNNLAAMDTLGTLYPTGGFAAPWGSLDVDGGALVSADYRLLRVEAPKSPVRPTDREVAGPGWKLRLNDGWQLAPGPRPGDWHVEKIPDGG